MGCGWWSQGSLLQLPLMRVGGGGCNLVGHAVGLWWVVVCAPSGMCSQTDNRLSFMIRYTHWL